MPNKPILYIVWLAGMCLAAVAITVGLFSVMIPPQSRETPFYFALSILCAAELVGFAWLAGYSLSKHFQIRISGATRITIHVLIGAYFLITLLFALGIAPAPEDAGRILNGVTLVYAALVFVLLFAAGMLYARDIGLRTETAADGAESRDLKLVKLDVETIRTALRESAKMHSADAAAVERVAKKIEAIATSLQYAPGAKPAAAEEDGWRSVQDLNDKIKSEIETLSRTVADMSDPATFEEKLNAVDATANKIETLLKQRQQQLLV
ncbi:MAG: hypothetical protein JW720_08845 [Sedimentisphaerales bacterium]|nr:hypothetical protein [Sedimentisphaerales bacterium]